MKGWRAWDLSTDERGPVLASPERGPVLASLANRHMLPSFVFGEREAWATCWHGHQKPPKAKCSCGLYSAESLDAAQAWLPANCVAVGGKVELLGRVIQGSPDQYSRMANKLMPGIGAATGRQVSAEYRSAGVRLKGTQRLHPDYADAAAALADRYGVKFRVDPSLAEPFDVSAELETLGRDMFARSMRMLTS